MVDPTLELLTNTLNVYSGDSSVASFSNVGVSASFGNGEGFQNARSISDREERSTLEEDTLPNSVVDRVNVVEVPNHSSLDTISQECSLSLLSICSTAQQRRLLRTHGYVNFSITFSIFWGVYVGSMPSLIGILQHNGTVTIGTLRWSCLVKCCSYGFYLIF
ncbi:unnamed protein product [Camellia sinensis]